MKTFVIDDDQISLFLTQHVLEIEKFSDDVSTYLSAEEALAVLTDIEKEQLPGIIFLDLNMPEMNGWEFLHALEPLHEKLDGKCRIYVLTSSLDFKDTMKAKEHVFVQDLIHKPITGDDLKVILADLEDSTDVETYI